VEYFKGQPWVNLKIIFRVITQGFRWRIWEAFGLF